jgi:hypothetical protein
VLVAHLFGFSTNYGSALVKYSIKYKRLMTNNAATINKKKKKKKNSQIGPVQTQQLPQTWAYPEARALKVEIQL